LSQKLDNTDKEDGINFVIMMVARRTQWNNESCLNDSTKQIIKNTNTEYIKGVAQ